MDQIASEVLSRAIGYSDRTDAGHCVELRSVCLSDRLSVCLSEFFFCVCVLVCTWLPCKINLRLSLELETNKVGGEASDRSPC